MSKGLRRFLKNREGAVMLEAALMITVLLILTFGMVDFGRLMYTSNTLESAAREGAHFGAVQPSVVASSIDDVVRKRFNSYTFGGDTLTNAAITVVDSSANATPSVKVSISYTFKWITPIAGIASVIAKQSVSYTTSLHAQAQYRYEE